jgi:antitoxin ChpS
LQITNSKVIFKYNFGGDMYRSKLRAVGGSVMFAIPKPILDSLGLGPNAEVDLTISEGRLIVEPRARPRYTLAELLAQCDTSAPRSEEEQAWLDDEPVGRETI